LPNRGGFTLANCATLEIPNKALSMFHSFRSFIFRQERSLLPETGKFRNYLAEGFIFFQENISLHNQHQLKVA